LTSCLKVNFHKSSLIGFNLDEDYTIDMINTIYCKWNTLSIQYLGILLGANLKRLSTWKLIVNKIITRLERLKKKNKFLSLTGCVCFLKTILSSLPLYYMLVFLMPKGVARVISSTQRWFICDGISDGKKLCKVSWNVIVRAKDKGGLGIVSLQGKNKAMLFK